MMNSKFGRIAPALMVAVLTTAVSGCASYNSGFQFPSFSLLNDDNMETASVKPKQEPQTYNNSAGTNSFDTASADGNWRPRAGSTGSPRSNKPDPMASADPIETGSISGLGGGFSTGDQLSQPVPRIASPALKSPAGPPRLRTITVLPGDTLYSLADRHDTKVNQIMRVNRLRSTNIAIGQQLLVPARKGQIRAQPAPRYASNRQVGTHIVRRGDTLFTISRYYRLDPIDIADLNGIEDWNGLYPGQRLSLPRR